MINQITIQLNIDNKDVNRIFLQSDAPELGDLGTIPIEYLEMNSNLRATYDAFVSEARKEYTSRVSTNDAFFSIIENITDDPTDSTIKRKVYCNLPYRTDFGFELPILVRHFRNEEPLFEMDFTDYLRGRWDRMVTLPDGSQVNEVTYWDSLLEQYPVKQVIRQTIQQEDAAGRFNRVTG